MLNRYDRLYRQIMKMPPGWKRDRRLAELMTMMEKEYRIPLLRKDPEWEEKNREAIELYKKISKSRTTI